MSSLSDLQKQFDYISQLKNSLNTEKPKIFCIGMQNAGKSSLLNALIDDFENKTFSVSDIRETASTKEVPYKNIIYVDTPGIGHSQKDDNTVYDSIINSDMNLFVHNTEGELLEEEIRFLKKIQNGWKNSKEFIDKTIFIISRADLVEPKEIDRLKNRVFIQIEEIFGAKPKIISTSSNDYIQGKTEDELELVKISNIVNLKQDIEKKNLDFKKNRKYKINSLIDKTLAEIENKLLLNNEKIDELENKIKLDKNSIDESLNQTQSTIDNILTRLLKPEGITFKPSKAVFRLRELAKEETWSLIDEVNKKFK